MSFINRMIKTITSPDKAMEEVAKEPHIEEALVIVAIYAVLTAVSTYLAATHMKYEYIGMDSAGLGTITAVMTVVMGLVMPFIGWVVATVVLYLFSMVFGGDGKFMTVLTAIGYSSLVKIFLLIVSILLLTQAPYLTIQMDPSNPFGSLGDMSTYTKNPFVLVSSLLTLVGLLWSCLIGVYGLKHAEKLSFTSAAIVVGVPTLIYIALQYGSIVLGLLG
jgi:hypothetical protein